MSTAFKTELDQAWRLAVRWPRAEALSFALQLLHLQMLRDHSVAIDMGLLDKIAGADVYAIGARGDQAERLRQLVREGMPAGHVVKAGAGRVGLAPDVDPFIDTR